MCTKLALLLLFCIAVSIAGTAGGGQTLVRYLDLPNGSQSRALAADSQGSLFAVSNIEEPSGRILIRVIKTDPQGGSLASIDFGGTGTNETDLVAGAAVDPQGDLVIVGTTNSPDFPLVAPVISRTTPQAAFVVRLDSQLRTILFSTRLGGLQGGGPTQGGTAAGGVAVDNAGNIYVTGSTSATDFPVTPSAFQTQPPKSDGFGTATYAFLTEFSASGNQIAFSSYFGGSETSCSGGSSCIGVFGTTRGTAIALDATGAVIIAGNTNAADLPVTMGAYAPQCGGCSRDQSAGFIAKVAVAGAKLVWATYLPLAQQGLLPPLQSSISVSDAALDSSGNVVGGGSAPNGFPVTSGALQTTYPLPSGTAYAGFVSKFDASGERLLFSTYLGGGVLNGGTNGVVSLALDSQGTIWATGGSVPSALPAAVAVPLLGPTYVVGLSSDGSSLTSIVTAPAEAAGQAIVASGAGTTAALGTAGSLLTATGATGPSLVGVVNSAAFAVSNAVAPYELISLYGDGLGPVSPVNAQVVNGLVTTSLAGIRVLFDDVAAPLLYAGPAQVNAIVPREVYGRDITRLRIVTPDGTIDGPSLAVRPSQPQVFRALSDNSLSMSALALNQDGTPNSASNPAPLGSVVTVWATGAGVLSPVKSDGAIAAGALSVPNLPVSVLRSADSAGATSLEVLYAGDAPLMVAGVLQVNFRLPLQVSAPGPLVCALQIGSAISASFQVYVKP